MPRYFFLHGLGVSRKENKLASNTLKFVLDSGKSSKGLGMHTKISQVELNQFVFLYFSMAENNPDVAAFHRLV